MCLGCIALGDNKHPQSEAGQKLMDAEASSEAQRRGTIAPMQAQMEEAKPKSSYGPALVSGYVGSGAAEYSVAQMMNAPDPIIVETPLSTSLDLPETPTPILDVAAPETASYSGPESAKVEYVEPHKADSAYIH